MGEDELRERIVAATLVCIGRWGISKTTLEDVAREAGCGRATIYRTFEGGKGAVLRAVLLSESARFRHDVEAAIAEADGLTDTVVDGVVAAARFVAEHDALNYLLAHEPDIVLPWVGFDRAGPLLELVGDFAADHLRPFLADDEAARRGAEWLARVVLTYVLNPADGVELADPVAARHLLTTYVIPGLAGRRSTSHVHH